MVPNSSAPTWGVEPRSVHCPDFYCCCLWVTRSSGRCQIADDSPSLVRGDTLHLAQRRRRRRRSVHDSRQRTSWEQSHEAASWELRQCLTQRRERLLHKHLWRDPVSRMCRTRSDGTAPAQDRRCRREARQMPSSSSDRWPGRQQRSVESSFVFDLMFSVQFDQEAPWLVFMRESPSPADTCKSDRFRRWSESYRSRRYGCWSSIRRACGL